LNTTQTASIDSALAGGRLTVDLGALVRNWRKLSALAPAAETSAVVKAVAYGLGAEPVVTALAKAGCETFFVAYAHEGAAVRRAAPKARIFVLTGAEPREYGAYVKSALIPMLSSVEQVRLWLAEGPKLPFGINIDTGMNRLGLHPGEAALLGADGAVLHGAGLCHIMSHLACADDPDHPMNQRQLQVFRRLAEIHPDVEKSFANSAGMFLGSDFHFDLTRPGIALYGGEAVNGVANPMEPVAQLETRVMQVRNSKAGETVSYGATETLKRDTRIAVCGTGYADGLHRASGAGVALRETGRPAGFGFIAGKKVPILGRVTMDLTMFDITGLPDGAVKTGDFVELFGRNVPLDDAARAAGTIGYEILTSLGKRYHRETIQHDKEHAF
jgi:alanine racemase